MSSRTPEYFWSFVNIRGKNDCWLWKGRQNRKGYGQVSYGGRTQVAHRVAYFLTYGPIPIGLYILHSCNNPPCCNPSHLRPGTHQENMSDRTKAGRAAKGAAIITNKLTEKQVLEIRTLYKTGKYTQRNLASMFNVSHQNIGSIVSKESWKHL